MRCELGKKLLWFLLVAWGCTTLVFFAGRIIPGDPTGSFMRENSQPRDRQAMRSRLRLDRPLAERYLLYLVDTASLRFGRSLVTDETVIARIGRHLAGSACLTLAALAVTLLTAFPLGLTIALRPGRWPSMLAGVCTSLGMAVPPFLLGLLFVLLVSVRLRWLPMSGSGTMAQLILPALSLGLYFAFPLARIIGDMLKRELQAPYILLARAKGLTQYRVLVRHALPNIRLPVVAALGMQLGSLLSGAVVTETVFSRPGIGILLINAIRQRDYPMIQGVSLFITLVYLTVHLLLDLMHPFLHPRARSSHAA